MPTAMETLLANLTLVVGEALTWVGDIASCVVANPIILVPFALGIIGFGAGMFLRLARPN